MTLTVTIHATTVAIRERAVTIEGPSGSGKSDLALRLIDRGAVLVSDDYTCLAPNDGKLYASAPATIAGRLEVRGLGIIDMARSGRLPVALAVVLGEPDRLPERETRMLAGIAIPSVTISPFEASAPIKVELALERTV